MEQVYKSKVDTWLGLILVGSKAACLFSFVVALDFGSTLAIALVLPSVVLGAGSPS